jgi:coenzyme F420 hydrogenase subunit beta
MPKIRNVRDVAERQLCTGCGACASVDPEHIRMIDVLDHGRRPLVEGPGEPSEESLAVCPGIHLEHPELVGRPGLLEDYLSVWGPILEVWEGCATDSEIRFAGSSGGAASALALYSIERGGMEGVLHIKARPDVPYLNHTVLSRTRAEVLEATGSRYAPASPCDSLDRIENAAGPCAFIGKPCDVAALQKVRAIRPELDRKVGVTIAFFCAGTPSTRGTLEMLRRMGFENPEDVQSVRYRGNGWPGLATAKGETRGAPRSATLTYSQSWGDILQKHRQWRCYICPDHTGEFADIAVGDPWYRSIPEDEPGRSLILVRTETGRKVLEDAVAAGYLSAERVDPKRLPESQPNLLATRGAVWGRLLALRLCGAGVPRYRRLPIFPTWLGSLPLRQKFQSIYGTIKRVFVKKLRERARMEPFVPRVPTIQGHGTGPGDPGAAGNAKSAGGRG